MSKPAPRTLAEQLRRWSDGELAELLAARPDLATPAPLDTAQLASRVGARASVLRVADQLTTLELGVLDAVVAVGGTASQRRIRDLVNAEPKAVDEAVARLCRLALLWGTPTALRALGAVADTLGTPISGLGADFAHLATAYGPFRVAEIASAWGLRPSGDRAVDVAAIATCLKDADRVARVTTSLPEDARAVLHRLEETGAQASVGGQEQRVGPLLGLGLVVAREPDLVAVPREVAIARRQGRTTRDRLDQPPDLVTGQRSQALVDRAAAGAAFDAVRHVELLLEHWGVEPPTALRAGGLGVRELRAAAQLMHVEEGLAALLVETAAAAGLLALGHTDELDAAWLPTEAFDRWSRLPVSDRWVKLAIAWLGNPRLTGTIGSRVDGKPLNALSPDLERSWLVATRAETLGQLAGLPAGTTLDAQNGVASLVARLAWLRPRRPVSRAEAVGWVLDDARALGLIASGGLALYAHLHLAQPERSGRRDRSARALEALLPAPVDHVLIQADLTAVAPGPLQPPVAESLALLADVESRGGATVYRFTESSLRRAFDHGWSAAEIHTFLDSASRTAVPQPLRYLVDDVARRFGALRVGTASAFVRTDDETALTNLVHDPRMAGLGLRRIAPTVAVTDMDVTEVLTKLRAAGTAPVLEATDGTIHVAKKRPLRAGASARGIGSRSGDDGQDPTAVLTAIRAGDRAATHRAGGASKSVTGRGSPVSMLASLREAAESREPAWIAYVDSDGSMMERMVEPIRVEGGWLTAHDQRSDSKRSFALHRIMSVKRVS